ncbi:recombinase family protein [Streptacidiphilus albus]|uniref:recombinase family protein n=1 Tax=Streptacidiphilus albus TaxID=105425 RepID=UPI00054C1BA2|nr:recombinase family protein [Streptacidiphilus albus]
MGRTVAYVRVSTRDQNPQMQIDAITAHGYDLMLTEKMSGRVNERPEWQRCLSELREGDTFLCWKSDRFGRSAGHVLSVVEDLTKRGIKVISLTESFDVSTKEGKFMFSVLAAAAEYETAIRAERQAEGIAAAKRRQESGQMLPDKKHMGRPRVIGPSEVETLRHLVESGKTVTEAARTLKISRSAAYAALKG